MAPRKPPKILLDKDPLSAALPTASPAEEAVLLHAPTEPSADDGLAADTTASSQPGSEGSDLATSDPGRLTPEAAMPEAAMPEPALVASAEPAPVIEAAPVAEAPSEPAPAAETPSLAPAISVLASAAVDASPPAGTVAAMVEHAAAAAPDRAAAFVEEAVAATVDAVAAAAASVETAAAPDRIETRLDAALELPRLMGGFMQRQTRRTMDGAVGLSRCRSLADAVELQGSLIRESMDDFVQANTDIAFRSLAVITGQRSTIC